MQKFSGQIRLEFAYKYTIFLNFLLGLEPISLSFSIGAIVIVIYVVHFSLFALDRTKQWSNRVPASRVQVGDLKIMKIINQVGSYILYLLVINTRLGWLR